MSKDYKEYIRDIIKSIKKIKKYTLNMDFSQFSSTDLVQDATIRNLEIIGEAIKKVPKKIKDENKDLLDWRAISGLRDILIHKYTEVNLEILWDIISNKLEDLEKQISQLL